MGFRRALTAAALLLAVACSEPEARLRVVERFAPAQPGQPAPQATIGDETRPVLRDFPAIPLVSEGRVAPDRAGRVAVQRELPPELSGATRLVVVPHAVRGRRWTRLRTVVTPVQREGGRSLARFEVALQGLGSARDLGLRAQARVPMEGGHEVHETQVVEIPRRARLEFGFGLLPLGWSQGPVRFAVSSCETGRCSQIFAEELDPERPRARAWQDRRLPLDDLAGRRVSLRFEVHFLGRAGGFTFPVWSDPRIAAPEAAAAPDTPNLILFSLDTLRADHLSSYGHALDTAPRLHALLAERGTLVVHCISPAPSTAPSHMTMFTALPPSVHSVRENLGGGALPASAVTLAEVLRARGFATAAVTEDAAISVPRGFARGFDSYVEMATSGPERAEGAIEATLARARRWLGRWRDRRFFLFVHTYQVHSPYVPPPPHDEAFADARPAAPPADARHDPLLYDREIRYADTVIGEFIESLTRAGLLENTLFVFTSDHGEEFLEHGFLEHGAALHEEVLRVPLMVTGPGIPPDRRLELPLGLADLMPTLLELLGVPDPGQGFGRSFAALLRGAPEDESWRTRPIFSEAWAPQALTPEGRRPVAQPTLAVRVGPRKLLRARNGAGFRYAYYDLDADPGERVDRYASAGGPARDLQALLRDYEARAQALRAQIADAEAPAEPAEQRLGPERLERLRALGYLE